MEEMDDHDQQREDTTQVPAPEHQRPDGVDDATVEALGRLSKALDLCEESRGHLYAFHRRTGDTDRVLGEAVQMFRDAGHAELADRIETEQVGRNVVTGRWTFQLVEDYDDGYWTTFRELDRLAREQLVEGRRHVHEAEMKEARRTHGRPGHEARQA